ncbi:alpha/beta hydrolase [Pelagibacterium limicola]|uniref:alpha/beta hydrolase n=1 Tax=Pelagibacterium limicola TaxID=2791022 RepID=UPI0018AFE53C|nr:alpha/beta fold hydrolase [Pelagibacterium limicola]
MDVIRRDFTVRTVDGVTIAVREVRPVGHANRTPMILMHGTRIPGISEYDLPVANGSLAADLAAAGHICYIVDARGFGGSQRPDAMALPPQPSAPLVRCMEIMRDIDAAADHLRAASQSEKVGLFGWGVGGTCVAMYAALYPEKASHLVLYCMVYGATADHPLINIGSPWDDPENSGRFNQKVYGNYTFNGIEMLETHWDEQIPIDDKVAWRDPEMVVAFRNALLDGDPTARTRTPPTYRSPNGMLEDLYLMGAKGQKLFHASQIYCPVFIVNPEYDSLCRDTDMAVFCEDLYHSPEVIHWRAANSTHYLLLDRPERGRSELLVRLDGFLN